MAKNANQKKDRSKTAGLIAFGVTLLIYAGLFSFNSLPDYLIGGALSALAGWVVKTMSTPLKSLDKNSKSKETLKSTTIQDEYARGIVQTGVKMLDALKAERDAINEYVFTRRINEIRHTLDKVLRGIIDDTDKASRLRKMNSYYLPTAVKLLESYRSAKTQGASYATVSPIREDVLSTLDQLNSALHKVLDAMLKDDLEDMDIEIDVFERMLKSDGLAEDEVTDSLRESAHAAAKEIPVSQAPEVKPAAHKPAAAPAVPAQPQTKPAARPAMPAHKPQPVTMDYSVPTDESERTPVPHLNVPVATASARQLQQGAPVLQVPQSPTAPDFSEEHNQHSKA